MQSRAATGEHFAGVDLTGIEDDLDKFQKDERVKEALEKGMDLRQYAQSIETQLREAEDDAIRQYAENSDDVASLYEQIECCDSILEKMESTLRGFQEHLGDISSEIKELQRDSLSMNVKLKNCKAAESKLGQFVEAIDIGPELATSICESDIDQSFTDSLVSLNAKIDFLDKESAVGVLCAENAAKHLDTLKRKAVARIRVFLMQKIHELNKAKTNIQIKQNVLLRFRYLFEFVCEHAKHVADELIEFYVSTMTALYLEHFRRYIGKVSRLRGRHDIQVAKSDLLGADPKKTGGLLSARKDEHHFIRVFSLGHRDSILQCPDRDPIIYHVAAEAKERTLSWFEIFRSCIRLLVNTASSEHLFTSEFFHHAELFKSISSPVVALLQDQLEQYLSACHDAIGVLLTIRIIQQQRQLMNRHRVHCLDHAFDRMNISLWPRFKFLIDRHLESLRSVQASPPSTSSSSDYHYITHRYALLCCAILTLNKSFGDEMVRATLQQIRNELCSTLLAITSTISAPKQQTIFLINNYNHILSVFSDNALSSDDSAVFEELLAQQVGLLVDSHLSESEAFARIVAIVKKQDAEDAAAPLDSGVIDSLLSGFSARWKPGIEQLSMSVQASFASQPARDRDAIVKQLLMQVLLNYQRFHEMVSRHCAADDPMLDELVPVQTMVYEIKKHVYS